MIIQHKFVNEIPDILEPSVLYISIQYRTASHACFCGCGLRVVTPIRPTRWQLFYDGDSVSLTPSIGNWSLPCQSHYWVRNNQVYRAKKWNAQQIAKARSEQKNRIDEYYSENKKDVFSFEVFPKIYNKWIHHLSRFTRMKKH